MKMRWHMIVRVEFDLHSIDSKRQGIIIMHVNTETLTGHYIIRLLYCQVRLDNTSDCITCIVLGIRASLDYLSKNE